MKIAFLGLGQMGTGMAERLLQAGHELVVWNRTRARAEALQRDRVVIAETPADAARGAEAVVSMLADDAAVESVVLGERGILRTLAGGAVHVSSSTVAPATARRLTAAHAHAGSRYLAAPVLGRPDAAAKGELVVLAAGPADARADAMPILDALGRETRVIGDEPAAANVVKLAVNFVLATMLEALGEAYALAESWGVADRTCFGAIEALLRPPVIAAYADKIASRDFYPAGFALTLGAKDVRLALESGEARGVPMPLATMLRYRFVAAMALGLGDVDWSAVARA